MGKCSSTDSNTHFVVKNREILVFSHPPRPKDLGCRRGIGMLKNEQHLSEIFVEGVASLDSKAYSCFQLQLLNGNT